MLIRYTVVGSASKMQYPSGMQRKVVTQGGRTLGHSAGSPRGLRAETARRPRPNPLFRASSAATEVFYSSIRSAFRQRSASVTPAEKAEQAQLFRRCVVATWNTVYNNKIK